MVFECQCIVFVCVCFAMCVYFDFRIIFIIYIFYSNLCIICLNLDRARLRVKICFINVYKHIITLLKDVGCRCGCLFMCDTRRVCVF